MDTCSINDEHCDGRVLPKYGWCYNHYQRWWKRGGDPAIRKPAVFVAGHGPRWAGDSISYRGAHRRVQRDRGMAHEHVCQCGAQAQEWAYQHDDPDEQLSSRGRPYSTDPSHYTPMCISCHRRMDKAA